MPETSCQRLPYKGEDLNLILSGGTVIDPLQSINEIMEVGIRGKLIAALGQNLPRCAKTRIINCTGLTVVPGLIDLHVHLFWGAQQLGIKPDDVMLQGGVTTMLDAGSAGSANWPAFQKKVINGSKARVLSLVHLCATGLDSLKELLDSSQADPAGAQAVIRQSPALVRGVKLRAGTHIIGEGHQGWRHLLQAIDVARSTNTWLMVHIGNTPMTLPELVARLSPGDVITHCYKGGPYYNQVLDSNGKVFPELLEAAHQGVHFDVGHGNGSFDFLVAERAIEQGLLPGTISTDLHAESIDNPVHDLPETMTKFLLLGFSLPEVVARCTLAPARVLGLADQIGSLQPGYAADVTLLGWKAEATELFDSYRNGRMSPGVLYAAGVIKSGDVIRSPA